MRVFRKMNVILWALVFHVAVGRNAEFTKYRDKRLSEITRHDRAAPPSPSKLSKLTTNHMKLARLTNGIYLQKGLADRSIAPSDLITSIWNFKTQKALEQLTNIPLANLTTRLKDLEGVVKGAVVDEVDVNEFKVKMEPVEAVKKRIGSIRAAVEFEYPEFYTSGLEFGALKDEKNELKECLSSLKAINNETDDKKYKTIITSLPGTVKAVTDIEGIRESLSTFLKFSEEVKTLKLIRESVPLIRAYLNQRTDLDSLGKMLETAQKSVNALKPLLAPDRGIPETMKMMDSVQLFLNGVQSANDSADTRTVAFQESRSFNELSDDVKDKWLLAVVNNGKPMENLPNALEPLIEFSKDIETIKGTIISLQSDKPIVVIKQVNAMLENIGGFSSVPQQVDSLAKVKNCLPVNSIQEPAAVEELLTLAKQMEPLMGSLDKLYAELQKVTVHETLNLKDGGELEEVIKNRKKAGAVAPEKSEILKKIIDGLEPYVTLVTAASPIIKADPNFANFANWNGLDETQITEVKKWIQSTNLHDPTKCDLTKTDSSSLPKLNALTKSVKQVQKNNVISELTNLTTALTKLSGDILRLDRSKRYNFDANDLKLSFVAAQPASILLEVAIGISALHQMSQVHGAKTDLQNVIGSEPIVQAAILKVKDPKAQASLKATWAQFAPVSAALTAYSKSLDDLEAKIQDKPEKSLADVGKAYKTAENIKFQGAIDLKPFTSSFQLFDAPDQSIKDLEATFKSIDNQLSNLGLAHTSFQKMGTALGDLRKQLDSFFGIDPSSAGQRLQNAKPAEEMSMLMIVAIAGGSVLLLSLLITAFFIWWCFFAHHKYKPLKKYPMKLGKGKVVTEPSYQSSPEEADWNYTYCKLQDIRLDINKRDKNNCTPLYNAVMKKEWKTVRGLLDKGALVDVNCGKHLRTCLHELVLQKDLVHGLWFIKAGAFDSQPAANGETVFTWSDRNGFHEMFAKYKDQHKERRIIPPNTPRPWNILVVNPNLLTPWQRRKLPLRVKSKITWGFDYDYKKHDLDQYTHIVMPSHYLANTHMIKLDDEDLFPYRCVASLANLMVESWITKMIDDPSVLLKDEDFIIEACEYDEYTGSVESPFQTSALLALKTDLHKGHPKLLTNARITILETKDPNFNRLRSEWEEIIELFGGTLAKTPVPDKGDNPQLPYQCGYDWYSNQRKSQNGCWVLKFDDSVIDPIYRSDKEGYTLVNFKFLPFCIAANYILCSTNMLVPLQFDEPSSKHEAETKSTTGAATKSTTGATKSTTGATKSTTGATKSTTKSTETKTKTPEMKSKIDKK